MTFKCEIKIRYKNKETVKAVADSIKIDDYDYANTRIVGRTIVSTIKSTSLKGLLRSVDDFISCASVSEKVIGNIKDK
ncbi:MAG: KEOPS complex subunit Pcc1 [Thermoplasmata archaeon]